MSDKEFLLTRITSEFHYGKWKMHMWGITEDGDSVHRTDIFEDYYYVAEDDLEILNRFPHQQINTSKTYKTFDGKKAYKIMSTSIREKNTLTKMHPDLLYESDVPPEFKYILDNDIKWSHKRNIGFFDIEVMPTDENEFPKPENPAHPITAITIRSSELGKTFVFTWHETETEDLTKPEIRDQGDVIYVFCPDEIDVILSFVKFVSEVKIDILTGWYSAQYDLPYILNRANRLNIDVSELSPVGRIRSYRKGEFWRIYMSGLDHIDMLDAVQDLNYNLTNFKLATAAKEILDNPDMEKLTHVTWRDWRDNYAGFLKYAVRDVEVLAEIDNALGIFDLYFTVQEMATLPDLSKVLSKSIVVDHYLLTEFHSKMAFPNRVTKKKQKYQGAIVIDPRDPGLHRDVGIVDYTSLYPTAVMTFNISPETFIASSNNLEDAGVKEEEFEARLKEIGKDVVDTGHYDELFGKRYWFMSQTDRVGVLPQALKKLFLTRKAINEKLSTEPDMAAHMRKVLDKRQYAIKIILNSAYGAMGFPWFRLYTPECADAITFFARRALEFSMEKLEEASFPVLYGDTDSCFFKENGKTEPEIQHWLTEFNEMLETEFTDRYNPACTPDYRMLDLKFEKDMERIYFGGAKKRYYGIVRGSGKKYVRGMNIIRKDAPTRVKEELGTFAELAVMGNLTGNHLAKFRMEIEEIPWTEFGVTKSFGKRFSEYKKNKPQHLKASQWANEILDLNITHSDSPYLFYVVSKCEDEIKPRERNTAICLREEDLRLIKSSKHLFEIDYDEWYKKQVITPLEEFALIPSVSSALEEYATSQSPAE